MNTMEVQFKGECPWNDIFILVDPDGSKKIRKYEILKKNDKSWFYNPANPKKEMDFMWKN